MQIKNPINEAITGVKINNTIYNIEANGTLDNVPEADARFWQENLHKFLILRKDKLEDIKEVEVVEIPTPKLEEVIESPIEIEAENDEDAIKQAEEILAVKEEVKVVKVKGKKK